jgi:hypothetical protein
MPLTAQQLINLSCQICRVPGMVQQAGQMLNMVLQDLAQVYDFDFERETAILNVTASGAAYPLPSDHLRTREVFYSINGTIFYLEQMPLEEYDQLFQGPGITNYPDRFAIQVETVPHTILFYPPPAQPLAVTVRYQPTPADIAAPENSSVIPWFPNQQVLLKQLNGWVSTLSDDDRADDFENKAQKGLSKFLVNSDDKEGYAQQVKLDRRTYRNRDNARPTKQTVY